MMTEVTAIIECVLENPQLQFIFSSFSYTASSATVLLHELMLLLALYMCEQTYPWEAAQNGL